jgi:hypothetical protein
VTPTEIMLLAVYRTPTVELSRICDQYLGLNPENAGKRAALKQLPFPAFRVRESNKAPYLVHVRDLARHIDTCRDAEEEARVHSQL